MLYISLFFFFLVGPLGGPMDFGFVIIVYLFDDIVSGIIMMQQDIRCMVRNIVEFPPKINGFLSCPRPIGMVEQEEVSVMPYCCIAIGGGR